MPTPEQDKADAELFRDIIRALSVERNRPVLMQMATALPSELVPQLITVGQEIVGGSKGDDARDAAFFRMVLKALSVEKNRGLLKQMGGALPPNLVPPLARRGQEIAAGR